MPNQLKRVLRKLLYFQMQTAKEKLISRKQDARRKIMMGGLFVKAGLDHYHKETPHLLYGMLLHCQKMITENDNAESYFSKLGEELMRPE